MIKISLSQIQLCVAEITSPAVTLMTWLKRSALPVLEVTGGSREVTARRYPGRILLGNGMIITIKKWIWGANFVVKPCVCKSNTYVLYIHILYKWIYIYIYYPLSRSSLENLLLSMFRWFSDWARSNSIIYMTNNARMMWHVVPIKRYQKKGGSSRIIMPFLCHSWEGRQFTYFP